MRITEPSEAEQVLENLHGALSARLAFGAHAPCPVEFTAAFLGLCKAQSCGKCVPCRIGLAQLERIMEDVLDGKAKPESLALAESTARDIYLSADCAIGYLAADVALQALKGFRDTFEGHVAYGGCNCDGSAPVPCVAACPAGVDIPGYLALVGAGRYDDAIALIRNDNPLPVACGYVCEHPCEEHCRRGMADDPLNIRGIKRFAADHAAGAPCPPAAETTGKNVAIVGGGPAGLTAAYYLALMGHSVTIFEQRDKLGGMLRYGIPSYRLPRERLDEEIAQILSTGIEARCNVSVGADVDFDELRERYDAVYLAIGAHSDKKLGIEGEGAEGVMSAVQMLRAIGDGLMPDFKGERIVVVGGGNVAMDVARSAARLNAEKVTVVYRRRIADMTAQPVEVEGAVAEGVQMLELTAPVSISETDGKVTGLVVQPQIIGGFSGGRPKPRNAAASAYEIPCDRVLVAIGQDVDSKIFAEAGVPVNRKIVRASETCEIAGMPGVFSGGDCVSGPATVIRAIAAGKVAAANIDEFLGFNHEITHGIDIPTPRIAGHVSCARSNMVEREGTSAVCDFELVEQGLTAEEAMQEASRCLRCDRFGFGAFRGGRQTKW